MDSISAIKSRLPIEELVASYCALQRKGRSFVCLCPFHNDTKPSLLVSPDKGIAYCFACQTGGDIFSFYQAIEGVDFAQAIKELAERTGVVLEQRVTPGQANAKKDEKQRARECLESAAAFYREQLSMSEPTLTYLKTRMVPVEQIKEFEIGFAPDSFSATYEHLLKSGFSRKEILSAGLGVQRELQEERIYDRFRNRCMFPIHDSQGGIVGFGGRTMAADDAKYVNSSDGILFHKSQLLYGLHKAKEAIREKKSVILVEGYFDVLACHKVGATNAVATCGTALTPEHVKLLRRYADTVTLCMDQDRAGQDAMERSFPLLAAEGLHVEAIVLPGKDPSETLASDPGLLENLLKTAALPYLDVVIQHMLSLDLTSPAIKRDAVQRVLQLIQTLPLSVERNDYLKKTAIALQTTESALEEDLQALTRSIPKASPQAQRKTLERAATPVSQYSPVEITLGIFLLYPRLRSLLPELFAPQEGFAAALYTALQNAPADAQKMTPEMLDLSEEHRVRVSILMLFCEEHGFTEWSESMAMREIRNNCQGANREMLREKQQDITKRLLLARQRGEKTAEAELLNEYDTLIKLMRKAT